MYNDPLADVWDCLEDYVYRLYLKPEICVIVEYCSEKQTATFGELFASAFENDLDTQDYSEIVSKRPTYRITADFTCSNFAEIRDIYELQSRTENSGSRLVCKNARVHFAPDFELVVDGAGAIEIKLSKEEADWHATLVAELCKHGARIAYCSPSQQQAYHPACVRPVTGCFINELPEEILASVLFEPYLGVIDRIRNLPVSESMTSDEHKQLRRLFSMRSVCKRWKELLDSKIHCSVGWLKRWVSAADLDKDRLTFALSRVNQLADSSDWCSFLDDFYNICPSTLSYAHGVQIRFSSVLAGAIPPNVFLQWLIMVPRKKASVRESSLLDHLYTYTPDASFCPKLIRSIVEKHGLWLFTTAIYPAQRASWINLLRQCIPILACNEYEEVFTESLRIYAEMLYAKKSPDEEQLLRFARDLLRQRAEIFRQEAGHRSFYRCICADHYYKTLNSASALLQMVYDNLWRERDSLYKSFCE